MADGRSRLRTLDDAEARDPVCVGDAVAQLALLRAAGLPVRPAAVVTRADLAAGVDLQEALRARRVLELLAWPEGPLGEPWQRRCKPEAPALERALREATAGGAGVALLRAWPAVRWQGRGWRATPRHAREPVLCLEVDGAGALYRTPDGRRLAGALAAPGLTPDEVEHLARVLWRACAALPGPLRVHWVLGHGPPSVERLDRAVPAAVEVEHLGAEAPGPELWSSFMLREHLPQALTPLAMDLWRHQLLPVVLSTVTGLPERATRERRMLPVDRVDGRLYWNVNRLRGIPAGRLLLRLSYWLDRSASERLWRVLDGVHLEGVPLAGLRQLWSLWQGARRLWRLGSRIAWGLDVQRATGWLRARAQEARATDVEDLVALDDTALLAQVDSALARTRALLAPGLALEILAVLAQHLAGRLWPAHPRVALAQVWATAGEAPSADVVRRLRELGCRLRQAAPDTDWTDPSAVRDALDRDAEARPRWQELLARHGHRCADEQDLAAPRWCEDPRPLLRAIARCAEGGVDAAPGLPEPGEWARLTGWLTRAAALRDWPGWATAAALMQLRTLLVEVGRRAVARGLLANVEATWMVDLETLQDLLLGRRRDPAPVRARVERAAAQHAWQRRRSPPDLVRSDGLPAPAAEPAMVLTGLAASPGQIEGDLRIVDDPATADVRAGEVVLLRAFSAGCAPLLAPAAALLTEAGDATGLGAVCARGLGLPAVVALGEAASELAAGARVRVDGARGIVERL